MSGNRERISKLIVWLAVIGLLWLPLQLLFLQGLTRVHRNLMDSAAEMLHKILAYDLIRFRNHLETEVVLTNILNSSFTAAEKVSDLEQWREQVLSGFCDVGSGAVDLLVVKGQKMYPDVKNYAPASLSVFLETLMWRFESLSSTQKAVKFLQDVQKRLDIRGNTRMPVFQWINLPVWVGISNRAFLNSWKADTVNKINATPGNSWAAFGRVKKYPDWMYLLLIHKQFLSKANLRKYSCLSAGKDGIIGSIFQTKAGANSDSGLISHEMGGLRRVGRVLYLSEFFPEYGLLQVEGTLPLFLWIYPILFLLVDIVLSLAFFVSSYFYWRGIPYGRWTVGRKIRLGMIIAGAIPIFLALMVSEAGIGAAIFHEIQAQNLNLEKELLNIESRFDVFRQKISERLRNGAENFPMPFQKEKGEAWVNSLSKLVEASEIDVVNEKGEVVIGRSDFFWAGYRASFLKPEIIKTLFWEWLFRGHYLVPGELEILGLLQTPQGRLSPIERLKKVLEMSRHRVGDVKEKMIAAVGKNFLNTLNSGLVEKRIESGKADSAVMLDMFLKGKETQFFNDIISAKGELMKFSYAGFNGLAFLSPILQADGHAQFLVVVFYRMSDLCENFFYNELASHEDKPRPIDIDLISLFKGKRNFGPGLSFAQKELVKKQLRDFGTTLRCVITGEDGIDRFFSARRSEKMPDYILVASTPVSELKNRIFELHYFRLLSVILLIVMLVPLFIWLRQLLTTPLFYLQTVVAGIQSGQREFPTRPFVIGEMKVLSDLFQETVDGLKQMDIAKTLQENFIPGAEADLGEFQILGRCEMMSLVGGDYYDWMPVSDEKYLIIVGDVTGHGLPAAIVVAMVKSGLTMLAGEDLQINEICRIINEEMLGTLARTKMMTCLVGLLDLRKRRFDYCNAGHAYPIAISADKEVRFLKQTNLPLGSLRKRIFKMSSYHFSDGEKLLIYSDGLVEEPDSKKEIIGYQGLLEIVKGLANCSPKEIVEKVYSAVLKHSGGAPPHDDMTMLILSCNAAKSASDADSTKI